MKVCGKRDVLVPECSDCSELEERVDAVEKCCDDAHEEIDTLDTDKADKGYVDDSIENVNQTIANVADTLGGRIDNIITASNPSVTTLWEGTIASVGNIAHLLDDVNNYDYVDVYYKTAYAEDEGYYGNVRIPAEQYANYTITLGGTARDEAGLTGLMQYLTQLSIVDDTVTIDDIRSWAWDGDNSTDAADDPQPLAGIIIYRIDGVKESGGSLEIADAREGVDGTIYPSLGDAIRGQIQDTRDMIPQLIKTVNGNPIVIDDAFGEVKKLDVELLPIQAGTGTPSPQNIRPITGHDSVTVRDTGVNQWDEEWEVGGISGTTGANWNTNDRIRSKNYIKVLPSTSYYYKIPPSGIGFNVAYYDESKTFISSITVGNEPKTTPANCAYMRFATYAQYGATYNDDISINYPSTDHDYHAYFGQSKTVTLPHTVYGAGVGVTSGSGKEKIATYTFTGTNSMSNLQEGTNTVRAYISSSVFTPMMKPNDTTTNNIIADIMPTYAPDYIYSHDEMGISENKNPNSNGIWIRINKDQLSEYSYDGIRAWLANNPMTVAYLMKDEVDLSTTPTSLTLYNGDNVISSDGDIDLTYVQDMAIVIRKIEAQI